MLKRFWFTFGSFQHPTPLNFGCGVTAHDYQDALAIMRDSVFQGATPAVQDCVENVDVSRLEPKHVLPNLGNVLVRGVWFPLGHELRR
jgi:hypothetical protein